MKNYPKEIQQVIESYEFPAELVVVPDYDVYKEKVEKYGPAKLLEFCWNENYGCIETRSKVLHNQNVFATEELRQAVEILCEQVPAYMMWAKYQVLYHEAAKLATHIALATRQPPIPDFEPYSDKPEGYESAW